MYQWLWAHAPYFGVAFLAWTGASVRAAYVEIRREKLERWLLEQRRVPRT